MDYLNNSFVLYGGRTGAYYYVRPIQLPQQVDFEIRYTNNIMNQYVNHLPKKTYEKNNSAASPFDYDVPKEIEDFFTTRNVTPTVFLGISSDIIEQINQTLTLTTGHGLLHNMKIEFCNTEKMSKKYKKLSGLVWTNMVRGFCIPGNNKLIYVLHDSLLNMMITLGHEIGHILTPSRQNRITEEAKAYAFEIMWLEKIKEHNILDLGPVIDLSKLGTPASNGVHDVAFRWVNSFLMDGKVASEIYKDIVDGEIVIVE